MLPTECEADIFVPFAVLLFTFFSIMFVIFRFTPNPGIRSMLRVITAVGTFLILLPGGFIILSACNV